MEEVLFSKSNQNINEFTKLEDWVRDSEQIKKTLEKVKLRNDH